MNLKNSKFSSWESRIKKIYRGGMLFMKDGLHGLEVVVGKTWELTGIKLANQRALNEIQNHFMELGQRVYDALADKPQSAIKVTPDMGSYVSRIQRLQTQIEKNLHRLKHATTVGAGKKTPKRSPVKK